MARWRGLSPVVLVAVLAIIALTALRGGSGHTTATLLPTPLPEATGQSWTLAGAIGSMSGQFWSIAGVPIRVTDSTRIQSETPITIGTTVEVTGVVAPDGTWIATSVVASPASTPILVPAGPPTVTSAASATPTPEPTAITIYHAYFPEVLARKPAPVATPRKLQAPTPKKPHPPVPTRARAPVPKKSH